VGALSRKLVMHFYL